MKWKQKNPISHLCQSQGCMKPGQSFNLNDTTEWPSCIPVHALPVHSLCVTGVFHMARQTYCKRRWVHRQLWGLTIAVFMVYIHYDSVRRFLTCAWDMRLSDMMTTCSAPHPYILLPMDSSFCSNQAVRVCVSWWSGFGGTEWNFSVGCFQNLAYSCCFLQKWSTLA